MNNRKREIKLVEISLEQMRTILAGIESSKLDKINFDAEIDKINEDMHVLNHEMSRINLEMDRLLGKLNHLVACELNLIDEEE